jgi:hypothetical protein
LVDLGVAFHVAHFNVADVFSHDVLAFLASEYEQRHDGCLMNCGKTLDRRNEITFE